jgi:hypothetical protein
MIRRAPVRRAGVQEAAHPIALHAKEQLTPNLSSEAGFKIHRASSLDHLKNCLTFQNGVHLDARRRSHGSDGSSHGLLGYGTV